MASMKSISSALGSIDSKKENLRKAFEDLQSHSSSLSTFTLEWKDLEDHIDSTRKLMEARFKELESLQNQTSSPAKQEQPPESNSHPEMKSFCLKMDGIGLRTYILNHRKELASIRDEIGVALGSALDAPKLVLDAMKGFYPPNSKGDKDGELAALRRTCLLLLEQLIAISPHISAEIKDRAEKLAVEWKGNVCADGENTLEALALLQLLATYGVVASFEADDVLELAVFVARRKQAVDLVRSLGIPDKIPNFIEKLTSKGKQLEAVKFVYAFELVDKFPPVPLLKDYCKQSKKVAQDIRNKGNHSVQSLNEAIGKELAAVKAIIKCIEEHKLESEYPKGTLDKRIEQLEKQRAENKKRPAASSGSTPTDRKQQQQQQSGGNKRPRPMVGPHPSIPQNHLQPPIGSVMDRFAPYMSSQAQYSLGGGAPTGPSSYMSNTGGGPYGLGTNPVSPYGLGGGNPVSYGMNLSPSRSHLYSSSESHLGAGLYDRPPMNYGGPGMPTSHRSLYFP
ncbi:hypothetical protein ACHQM5_002646 [Ranunculus cassubicifolius]